LFGLPSAEEFNGDCDTYLAQVLAYYFSRFLLIANQDRRALLLNYEQGSMAILESVADLCGIRLSDAERSTMEVRSRFHSKYPNQGFAEEAPTLSVPPSLAGAQALYERVEQLRVAQTVLRADARPHSQ